MQQSELLKRSKIPTARLSSLREFYIGTCDRSMTSKSLASKQQRSAKTFVAANTASIQALCWYSELGKNTESYCSAKADIDYIRSVVLTDRARSLTYRLDNKTIAMHTTIFSEDPTDILPLLRQDGSTVIELVKQSVDEDTVACAEILSLLGKATLSEARQLGADTLQCGIRMLMHSVDDYQCFRCNNVPVPQLALKRSDLLKKLAGMERKLDRGAKIFVLVTEGEAAVGAVEAVDGQPAVAAADEVLAKIAVYELREILNGTCHVDSENNVYIPVTIYDSRIANPQYVGLADAVKVSAEASLTTLPADEVRTLLKDCTDVFAMLVPLQSLMLCPKARRMLMVALQNDTNPQL